MAAAFLSTACGGADERTDQKKPREIDNTTPEWSQGAEWKVSPSPLVVIGLDDGRAEYQFDRIVGTARLRDGRIVVADGGSGEIRYYSGQGEHLATVGGQGDGPGEFRRLDWIGVRGDSLYAWDSFAARLSVFGPRGILARGLRVDGLATIPFPKVVGLMGDGILVVRPSGTLDAAGTLAGERRDSVDYFAIDAGDGRVSGRLGRFLLGERFVTRRGGAYLAEYVVFGRRGTLVPHPRGFYAGENGSFRITAYGTDGAPLRTIGRTHEPVPVRRSDVQRYLARLRNSQDFVGLFPELAGVQRAQLERLPHRSTFPAYARVVVDTEGFVWMEEFRTDPESPPLWSVFTAEGRWLGRVATPAGLEIRQIGADRLVGVLRDELGVERVAVHAISR